jgi:hypothetical protein
MNYGTTGDSERGGEADQSDYQKREAAGDQSGYEESSLTQSPEVNREVRPTRYRLFTIVAVVSALFGSILYISSSVRGKESGPLFAFPEGAKNKSHASQIEIVEPFTITMLDDTEMPASNRYPQHKQMGMSGLKQKEKPNHNEEKKKSVNIGPNTTIKDIIDQLLWGPSPPKDQSNDHEENHRKPKPKPQPTMTPNIRSNPPPTHTVKPRAKYLTHAPTNIQLIIPSPSQSPVQAHCPETPTELPSYHCPETSTEHPSYIGTKTINSTVILCKQIYDHSHHYLYRHKCILFFSL